MGLNEITKENVDGDRKRFDSKLWGFLTFGGQEDAEEPAKKTEVGGKIKNSGFLDAKLRGRKGFKKKRVINNGE